MRQVVRGTAMFPARLAGELLAVVGCRWRNAGRAAIAAQAMKHTLFVVSLLASMVVARACGSWLITPTPWLARGTSATLDGVAALRMGEAWAVCSYHVLANPPCGTEEFPLLLTLTGSALRRLPTTALELRLGR